MKKLSIGNLYFVEYEDASFLYTKKLPSNVTPPLIQSVGRIRRQEKNFIDLGLTWNEDMYKSGLIIPMSAIKRIKKLNI